MSRPSKRSEKRYPGMTDFLEDQEGEVKPGEAIHGDRWRWHQPIPPMVSTKDDVELPRLIAEWRKKNLVAKP